MLTIAMDSVTGSESIASALLLTFEKQSPHFTPPAGIKHSTEGSHLLTAPRDCHGLASWHPDSWPRGCSKLWTGPDTALAAWADLGS